MPKKPSYMSLLLSSSLVAATLLLAACEPKVSIRGNLPRESQMAQIVPGQATKRQVAEVFGTPSTLGTFDGNVWYYMSRRTEQLAFFDPEIIEHQVLVLRFEGQTLQEMQTFTKDDLTRIHMEAETTPTAGHELNILEQLMGNFGRFN